TISSYALKITDEVFELNGKTYSQTARISLRDQNKNLIEKRKYGVINLEELYSKINAGADIDISGCLLHNFSLADYRLQYDINKNESVSLSNLNASNSFFEADKLADFSYALFTGETTSFQGAHFGSGNTSFLNSSFQTPNVDFSDTSFSEGNNVFQYTQFCDGNLTFENANFSNGNISFVNAIFNNGDANFKNVNFGDGEVSFRFASFGAGIVNFEKSVFGGALSDFSKVDFGSGKVDFRRCNFKNSLVSFEEIITNAEKIQFRRASFGNQPVSFKNAETPNTEINLDEAEFGDGRISFFNVTAKAISIKSAILSSYIDLRVNSCHTVDLSNTIIQNILDFKKGVSAVEIDRLYIYGVRNLGKLFINWDENNVDKCICQQTKTSYKQKAEQFRLLKEDFNTLGQYEDEDKAYIEFKRNELKNSVYVASKKGTISKAKAYANFGFQKLIFDWMGLYATSPIRVLVSVLLVYGFYSALYILFELTNHGQISCIAVDMSAWEKIIDSFYFSAVTFLTIGYGECTPTGFFKIIAPLEGLTGVFMMSYFTVAFVRKILR
ncbi:MAG: hypothetical protein ACI8Q1_002792, partial [Parvicella sp.]